MKKVLIITYYWPPSGGGGVQRWLKFVKYLRDFQWEPVIYTPKNPDFELRDESLLNDIPKDIEVVKQPIWEPFSLYRRIFGNKAVQQQGVVSKSPSLLSRIAVWIRGNYFIPDARVFWVRPSVNFLTRYLKKSPDDVIISTGPPHSLHLIALELKNRTGTPWLADFRDPWSEWDVLQQLNLNKRSWASHRSLEKKVLEGADLVVATSPSTTNALSKLGATNTRLITNGFDTELQRADDVTIDKFRISHIGLLNVIRNPLMLWHVLNDLCRENADFAAELEIYLGGTIADEVVQSLSTFEYLNEKITLAGYRSHNELLADYAASALLLLLTNNTANTQCNIPGKTFEYLAQPRPILAFGDPDNDVSTVLSSVGLDVCVNYTDYDLIKSRVLTVFEKYKNDSLHTEEKDIDRYHRKNLTEELATCLDELS